MGAAHPDKASLIYYGREVSFGELDRLSDAFAAWLHAHGVRKGDAVAVFMANCPQFHIAFFGILKIGAIHVPVNPLFKGHELIYELNDTCAKTIVALDTLFALVQEVKDKTSIDTVLVTSMGAMLPSEPTIPLPAGLDAPAQYCDGAIDFLSALAGVKSKPPRVDVSLDDVAALNYTGGTTGMPKGCVHTQRDMVYTAATTCNIGIDLKPDDVGINFYPVFWIAGEDMGVIFPIFRRDLRAAGPLGPRRLHGTAALPRDGREPSGRQCRGGDGARARRRVRPAFARTGALLLLRQEAQH